jgi:hypothetical protein
MLLLGPQLRVPLGLLPLAGRWGWQRRECSAPSCNSRAASNDVVCLRTAVGQQQPRKVVPAAFATKRRAKLGVLVVGVLTGASKRPSPRHVRLARLPLVARWLERSFLNLPFRSPSRSFTSPPSPLSGFRIVTSSSVRSLSPSLLLVDFCEVLPLLSAFAHVHFSTILHLGSACPLLDNSPVPLLDI